MRSRPTRTGRINVAKSAHLHARRLFLAESLEGRVLLSAPIITGVNPDPVDLYSADYASMVHFVINGSNFNIGLASRARRVTLTTPQGVTEQEIGNVDIADSSSTQIILNTPDFNPPPTDGGAGLTPGQWTVQVVNSTGSASGKFGFDVTRFDFPPVITSVTPYPLIIPSTGNVSFTIEGSNFQFDANSLPNLEHTAGVALQPITSNEGIVAPAADIDLATSSDTVLNITTSVFDTEPRGLSQINIISGLLFAGPPFTLETESPLAPTITGQPQSRTVPIDADVTFSVSASSNVPLSYQWEYDGATLANATLSTLTLNNVAASQSGEYQVIVRDEAGAVTSEGAFLDATAHPIILTQPKNQTIQTGSNVTFSVSADSGTALQYQWQFKGADLPGDTNSSLALSNVQPAQAGAYDVVVTNSAGSATSDPATLTVTPAPQPPTITTQPQNQTVNAGATVTFSVSASSTIPLRYQWQFNGSDISGATNPALTLANVTAAQTGAYTVVVSNSAGSVTSNPATLTISATPQPPNIFTQPISQTVTVGDNVTFSVSASSSTALSYQWKFNGVNLSGDTDSTLTLTNVAAAQAGTYTVVVSNSVGSANSAAATLAVVQPGAMPTITTEPASQSVTTGDNVTFSVSASSSSALSYQWQLNGADLDGQTDSSLTLANVTTADAGAYSVVVSNAIASLASAAATLTVNPAVSAPSSPLSFVLTGPAVAVKAGKRGKSVLTITNTTGQTIKQSLSLNLLLSGDGTLAGQVAGLLDSGKRINLKAGKSKRFVLAFKIPKLSAGDYTLLAQINGGTPIVAPSPITLLVIAGKK